MDLSIIIVNWNSAEYVRKCLSSLYENTKNVDFEVIVIDNGSFDDCAKKVLNEFPQVLFLQSNDNLGFAKANNYGSEKASGECLLFLNPDTEIVDDAAGGMWSIMKNLPNAAVLGCKLLNSDRSLQTSCVQPFPTILNQVLDSDWITRIIPHPLNGKVEYSKREPVKVQMVSGACLMIRKEIFVEVGKFSPEYFMYTEDLDLCYKTQKAGYSNYYTGAFSVIHHGGGSSYQRKENSFANIQMRESIFKFLRKTRGNLYAEIYRKAMLLNGIARFGILWLKITVFGSTGQESTGRSSLMKWRGIIRWTLGIEKWAR